MSHPLMSSKPKQSTLKEGVKVPVGEQNSSLATALGLRYKEDLRTLGFGILYVAIVAGQFIVDVEPFWLRVVMFFVTGFSAFQGAVSVHNAVHCPTFKNMTANCMFQVTPLCSGLFHFGGLTHGSRCS